MIKEIVKALEELGGSGVIGDISEKSGIAKPMLNDNLNTMYKRGEINKTFTNMGKYRYGHVGLCTKYQYVYSLK